MLDKINLLGNYYISNLSNNNGKRDLLKSDTDEENTKNKTFSGLENYDPNCHIVPRIQDKSLVERIKEAQEEINRKSTTSEKFKEILKSISAHRNV